MSPTPIQGNIESRNQQLDAFDKAILAISTGAITAVLGFAKQTFPSPRIETIGYFGWGLSAIGISFCLTLLSFLLSAQAMTRQIEIHIEIKSGKPANKNGWKIATIVVNWLSFGALVSGVALLALFVFHNMAWTQK